jgi:hypothetical protein
MFRDFTEANVAIKSVDFISVLWRTREGYPGHFPLNPALVKKPPEIFNVITTRNSFL